MRSINILPTSEAKQRALEKKWCEGNWQVEDAPFMFEKSDKKGQYDILAAPCAYIENLSASVLDLLDNLEQ